MLIEGPCVDISDLEILITPVRQAKKIFPSPSIRALRENVA